MIGKQINFYITEGDILLIDNYLSMNDFIILNSNNINKLAPQLDKSLAFLPNEKVTHKYLTLTSLLSEIKTKPYQNPLLQNQYEIDAFTSPVIAYTPCLYDFEDEYFRAGRLYIFKKIRKDESYFPQNEELMAKYEQLTDWLKSQFRKQKNNPFAGFYASEEMLKLTSKKLETVLQ